MIHRILPIVTDDNVFIYFEKDYVGIHPFWPHCILYTYRIIKESIAYRPVAISLLEADKLVYPDLDTAKGSQIKDINGNTFKVKLESITYGEYGMR